LATILATLLQISFGIAGPPAESLNEVYAPPSWEKQLNEKNRIELY
jgi:hypothetical protein